MNNKKIFITGGAGFLGKNIIKRYYNNNEITIYSRDEAKHYFIKKQYPKINCIIGDIADFDNLKRSTIGHNVGIFAASLKQIEAVDENYEIAARTIILGAINSRRCAEENGFESACFISSDKSRAATTLYGSMKFVGGESFIVNSQKSHTKLTTAIYGNVMNSTGSIIPLIWDSINKKYELKLYSKEMTRFMLSIDDAIDVVETAILMNISGYNVIPTAKSFLIKELFEIYSEEFGLKYVTTAPRISEKIHEIMISNEEVSRVTTMNTNNYFFMHHKNVYNEIKLINNEYSSRDCLITKEELYKYLKKQNFYKS
jgi:UDP-N-acetylglucosamine 4,6-dehydratase/5-epimerase